MEDVAREGCFGEAMNDAGVLCHSFHVAEADVAQLCAWHIGRLCHTLHAPRHVDLKDVARLCNGDVLEENVLHDAAARGLTLEAYGVPVLAREVASAHGDVANASRHFAAHGYTAVTIVEMAVLNQDVLRGLVHLSAVGVLSALDGDTVVVRLDVDVPDLHVGA